ncbi:MAG: hypothetical protein U9R55_11700 [Pseudomonadota bacterium]|nr:hypothetical protein [Pseudomonadota bacterium]
MGEIFEKLDGEFAALSNGYLSEYRLLDRVNRMSNNKLKKSYTDRKLAQVQRWIREGRGQGRGEAYSPWIRITRGFSSPTSHQVFGALSIHERNHHFLSKLEHHTALQLAFLGAVELRECLPMWPTEHKHPIREHSDARTIGLLEIAQDAGIEHGNFVGSNVPYIASLDIMATVGWNGQRHHLGISCKPDEIYRNSTRAHERVTLDAIYCQTVGARHLREGGKTFDPILIRNLEAYRPTRREVLQWSGSEQLTLVSALLNEPDDGCPLHLRISQAGRAAGVSEILAGTLWRVGLWLHLIDIDMSRRISMLRPIQRGRDSCLRRLAEHFLGVPT